MSHIRGVGPVFFNGRIFNIIISHSGGVGPVASGQGYIFLILVRLGHEGTYSSGFLTWVGLDRPLIAGSRQAYTFLTSVGLARKVL